MSTNKINCIEAKVDSDGKNKEKIFCTFCPSKILNDAAATFINIEYSLPYIHKNETAEADQQEAINDYWLVENMFTFENIGVSNTVGNVKYLACADCERGPVGWHDLGSKKSYIALSRVKHQ
ncbi:guanine nucleotide exchange factor MSS4 homolog [Prorops nasuta]|uniref:guanine nucleotide exchange factor MSS4 homolog n=1 Tax=Prorops nasuta TaxID=863751 RepID=UPI0034CEE394